MIWVFFFSFCFQGKTREYLYVDVLSSRKMGDPRHTSEDRGNVWVQRVTVNMRYTCSII